MIAQLVQKRQRVQPVDVGCIFPYGRGGRNLRVYLITDNPLQAASLGNKLADWGLIRDDQLVINPGLQQSALVQNFWKRKQFEPLLGQVDFPVVKFGGQPIALGTTDREEVVAFARWLTEKFTKTKLAAEAAKKAEPSLKNLADAGEIETIE